MIVPKADVFDRVEQSVDFFKKNIFLLSASFVIFYIGFSFISELFSLIFLSGMEINESFFQNPMNILLQSSFIIALAVGILGIFLYSFLAIVFSLATFRAISLAYKGTETSISSNLLYGFKKLFASFTTYWNMFLYLAMAPSLIFILGGLIYVYSTQNGFNGVDTIGIVMMVFAVLLFLFFQIYRGIKAKFALCSAVDAESFTKENFKTSLSYTKNNWWRIVGNLILIGFAVAFLSGVANMILGLLGGIAGGGSNPFNDIDLGQSETALNPQMLEEMMGAAQTVLDEWGSFQLISFITGIAGAFVNAIFTSYTLTFLYFFFKRLQLESEEVEIKNISQMKHETRNDSLKRGEVEEL